MVATFLAAEVNYIGYPYWTEFSGGTRLAADGARPGRHSRHRTPPATRPR